MLQPLSCTQVRREFEKLKTPPTAAPHRTGDEEEGGEEVLGEIERGERAEGRGDGGGEEAAAVFTSPVCPSVCPSVCLSVYLSLCLCLCLCLSLSLCRTAYPSFRSSARLCTHA